MKIKNNPEISKKSKENKKTKLDKESILKSNERIRKIKEKEEIFNFLEKKLSVNRIIRYSKSKDIKDAIPIAWNFKNIDLEKVFNIATEYVLSKPSILNAIVENGTFDIFGTCLDKKNIKKLKESYKKNKLSKIKQILEKYNTKDGKKLNIEEIISTENCKPLILYKKLEQLVDENGEHLTKEKLNQILSGIKSIKKISLEDKFLNEFNNINQEKLTDYLNFLRNTGKAILKIINNNQNLDNTYLLQVAKSYGININQIKNKERFISLSINYINTSKTTAEIILEKKEKDIKEKIKNKNNKQIELKFTKGKDTKIPSKLLSDKDYLLYVNLIRQHNGMLNLIVSKLSKYLGANSYLLGKLEKLIDNKLDSNKDTYSGLKKIKKFIEGGKKIPLIGNLFSKLEKKYNYNLENFLEEEYFLKNGKLLNTDYIWLYSNNPNNLTKYNGEKAKNEKQQELPGRNQICKREDFVNILKSSPISEINSRGLTDYLLKAKMMYGNWKTAILYIKEEIGTNKLKEIITYHKNGHINDKSLKNLFNELDKSYNFAYLDNFNNFEKKETIIDDLEAIKQDIDSGQNLLVDNMKKTYQESKKGILNTNKAYNLISNYINKKEGILKISSQISKSLDEGLRNYILEIIGQNNNKLKNLINELKKGTEKEKQLANSLGIILETANTLGLQPIEILSTPEIINYMKYMFTDPLKGTISLIQGLVNQGKIPPKKGKELAIELEKKFKDNTEKLKSLFENLKSISISELTKELEGLNSFELQSLLKAANNQKLSQALNNGDYTQAAKIIKSMPEAEQKKIKLILDKSAGIRETALQVIEKANNNIFSPGQQPEETLKKVEKTANSDILNQYYKAQAELAKTGFYTEEEKQYVYNNIYYNSFVSQELKEQIKKQAEKDGIKLDLNQNKQQAQSKFIQTDNFNNLSQEEKVKYLLSENNKNIIIDYEEKNGIIKIKNPFSNNLENQTIEAPNIKQVNEKLILEYLQSIEFYQADEINFSKDLEKISKQLGINLDKPLTLEDIKNFTKNFSWQVLFKLENLNNIANIDKKYIQLYKKKFMENPENIDVYLDFIYFLNNKIDLLSKTGIYDHTENKLNLENLKTDDNPNYREFLKNFR